MTAISKRGLMGGTIGVFICLGIVFILPFLGFSQTTTIVDEIRNLRLLGSLAQALAEAGLAKSPFDVSVTVRLHLELTRIHDRTGLHYNNRPVAAAMAHVDSAASLPGLSPGLVASIDLELPCSRYSYIFLGRNLSVLIFAHAYMDTEDTPAHGASIVYDGTSSVKFSTD